MTDQAGKSSSSLVQRPGRTSTVQQGTQRHGARDPPEQAVQRPGADGGGMAACLVAQDGTETCAQGDRNQQMERKIPSRTQLGPAGRARLGSYSGREGPTRTAGHL